MFVDGTGTNLYVVSDIIDGKWVLLGIREGGNERIIPVKNAEALIRALNKVMFDIAAHTERERSAGRLPRRGSDPVAVGDGH